MKPLMLETIFSWTCAKCGTKCNAPADIIEGNCPKCGAYQGKSNYAVPQDRKGCPVGYAKYGRTV